MDKIRFQIMLLVVALLFWATPLMAAVIYSEDVDGEMAIPMPELDFVVGVNSILGTTYHGDMGSDYDSFIFNLPVNTVLTSVTYSFFNVDPMGSINNLYRTYKISPTGALGINSVSDRIYILQGSNVGTSPYLWDSFLAAKSGGQYLWSWASAGYSGHITTEDGAYWNYQIDFNVSAVPLPAAVWLFGSALLGLIGFSTHKKRY